MKLRISYKQRKKRPQNTEMKGALVHKKVINGISFLYDTNLFNAI